MSDHHYLEDRHVYQAFFFLRDILEVSESTIESSRNRIGFRFLLIHVKVINPNVQLSLTFFVFFA